MSNTSLSRRSLLAASGAAQAAAAAERRPVVVSPFAQSAAPRTPAAGNGAPIRIATTYAFEPHELARVAGAAPGVAVQVDVCKTPAELREKLRDAEVFYGGMRGEDLDYAPKLKWIQSGGAGVENMPENLQKSPVVLTNYARTFAPGISETAIGLLLCLTRGISRYYMPQFARREWKAIGTVKSDHHVELVGRTMGIVGMGGIGSAIARRAHYGFDMRVVGTDAKPIPAPEYVAELHDPGWFMTMVPQVDVLVAAAPHTPRTERMFNETVFRAMKKTAYFIAVSRGKLFDDMALVRALREGWIAGAGLDVFPQEPPPSSHPIFDCQNVVITPHTSGWSPDRQVRLIDLFVENVRRYASGLPLINVVDKQRGY